LNILIAKFNSEILKKLLKEKGKINEKYDSLNLNFLEIGIGSGIIFISILKEFSYYINKIFKNKHNIYFNNIQLNASGIDINEYCCKVSETNCIKHNLDKKDYELKNLSFEEFLEIHTFSK